MVYIIVLNWKNAVDTIACLDSLFKLKNADFKIVVCDNASPDDSYQKIHQWLCLHEYLYARKLIELDRKIAEQYLIPGDEDGVYLVQTGANLGYAGGNNVGIRLAMQQSDMRYVWVLNNDTEVDENALTYLVDKCQQDPNIGICGSKLVYDHDRTRLQALGGIYNPWLCTTQHYAAWQDSKKEFDDDDVVKNIDYIVGASMLISRQLLEKVGLLCEEYFLYYEELDFCMRSKKTFGISVASKSIVYHKEGGSTESGKSNVSDFFSIRNRILFTSKFNPMYLPVVYVSLFACAINRFRRFEFAKAFNILKFALGFSVSF
jgi:hypothetical protein